MAARQYNNFSTLATDPMRNFKFLVKIKHNPVNYGTTGKGYLGVLGFTSVSGLTMTTESIPYRQGGYNTTVHQIPGQTTFSPITLQRGVAVGSRQSWDWMRQLFSTVLGTGNFPAGGGGDKNKNFAGRRSFRCQVDIGVLDHPVTQDFSDENDINTQAEANATSGGSGFLNVPIKLNFRVYNAWIQTLSYSDLNAGDNSLLVEQMTLVHEGFDARFADNINENSEAGPHPV